jgi:methyl-accepting chemotaxis protein
LAKWREVLTKWGSWCEQAQGIEQVNRAVTEIDKVVQQAAANAEESASEEMSAQAREMKEMIEELVALMGRTRSVALTPSPLPSLSPALRRAVSG